LALKENTELKVNRVELQQELKRYRKTLITAERDLEIYKQQIIELSQKLKSRHASESQKEELEELQRILEEKEAEIQELREKLAEGGEGSEEVQKLRDEKADLEYDIRERDRAVEERDEEIVSDPTECDS